MHLQHYGNRLMVITFNLYVFTRQLQKPLYKGVISRLPEKKKNQKKKNEKNNHFQLKKPNSFDFF